MNEMKDLRELKQKTTRNSMEDGLMYFPFSLILLMMAFIVQMPYFVSFLAIIIIFGPKAIEHLRVKYTYPRIGFVKLQEEDPTELSKGFLGFLFIVFLVPIALVIFLLGGNTTLAMLFQWLPFAFGFTMLGPSIYLVDLTGSRVYYLLGIATSITGFLFSLFIGPGLLGIVTYMLGWSLVTMLTGFILFIRFVRKYPILEMEDFGGADQYSRQEDVDGER
ncbi:MAG: hypothetical protein RTU63_09210 [Candidatus Thorarchaeota archaeon]